MAALILAALTVAWLWHTIDLFRSVDPDTLPPRARRWLARRTRDAEWSASDAPDPAAYGSGVAEDARMGAALRLVESSRAR